VSRRPLARRTPDPMRHGQVVELQVLLHLAHGATELGTRLVEGGGETGDGGEHHSVDEEAEDLGAARRGEGEVGGGSVAVRDEERGRERGGEVAVWWWLACSCVCVCVCVCVRARACARCVRVSVGVSASAGGGVSVRACVGVCVRMCVRV